MRAYSATVGAADGSIIAAIITTHTPRNQPSAPSAVPGPASMPAIRSAVDHHATAASAAPPARPAPPPPPPRAPAAEHPGGGARGAGGGPANAGPSPRGSAPP